MEQRSYGGSIGNRLGRFEAAYGSSQLPGVPWLMIDGGHQIRHGIESDYYKSYKKIADNELARPPMADISATYGREGNHFVYDVTVKNQSGVALSAQANSAAVTVIVYEDGRAAAGVQVSGRRVRAVATKPIDTELLNDSSVHYSLQTADLSGVNWSKLHSVVFAEYRPGGASGAFDMLQAAVPTAPWFAVQPGSLTFLIDGLNPKNQVQTLQMSGLPATTTWNAAQSVEWLSVTPSSGNVGRAANVEVDVSHLARGKYSGSITITAAGGGLNFSQTIGVQVAFTQVWDLYIPIGLK